MNLQSDSAVVVHSEGQHLREPENFSEFHINIILKYFPREKKRTHLCSLLCRSEDLHPPHLRSPYSHTGTILW